MGAILSGRTWLALILIVIGGLLLLQAFGVTLPSRWWALLLLIPVVLGAFGGWRVYTREGKVSLGSAAPFAGAVAAFLLMLAILVGIAINWSVIGPIALILVGVGLLTRRLR